MAAPETDDIADHAAAEHRVLILGAAASPGAALASALASRGARVIALGDEAAGLRQIAGECPGRIEPLALRALDADSFAGLGRAWRGAPLQAVVNLMPLAQSRDPTGQIAALRQVLLALMRGMVAGQGRLINVVAAPTDPLDLASAAMQGAFEAAQRSLNTVLKDHGVYTHLVSADGARPEATLPMLTFLAGPRVAGPARN